MSGQPKKELKTVRVSLALACDKYVDGQDRLAGYVILSGECVGNITADDINRALQRGELKALATQTKAN